MFRYIVRRLLESLVVLLIVSIVVFVAGRMTPGDPALLMMGTSAIEEGAQQRLVEIRREMGLDQPIPVQYVTWLSKVATGNLGNSVRSGTPVWNLILERLPATVELVLISLAIGIAIALPAGISSAVRHRSWWDYLVGLLTASGIAIPNFWFGLLLIYLFSINLGWFRASGYVPFWESPQQNLQMAILPSTTLGLYLAAYLTRFLRTDMLEVLGEDYIRTARAKGLTSFTVLYRHALRNALGNTLTILGILVGSLLGGVVIIEQVFGWSGIGWLAVQAVFNRDYPVVQGVTLLGAATFLMVNLVVDISYGFVDPRVTYS
ncbi:MAG: ABC transporter permease [Chloroflexota bacterium]